MTDSVPAPTPNPQGLDNVSCDLCHGTGRYKVHITTTGNSEGWDEEYPCNHQVVIYGARGNAEHSAALLPPDQPSQAETSTKPSELDRDGE